MSYAWVIDKDHLDDGAEGVMGPGEAPDALCDFLTERTPKSKRPEGVDVYTFRMRDGDGILYYTGRMVTDEGATEDACYSPLGDYGQGAAGCVDVTYAGHPEMACG